MLYIGAMRIRTLPLVNPKAAFLSGKWYAGLQSFGIAQRL